MLAAEYEKGKTHGGWDSEYPLARQYEQEKHAQPVSQVSSGFAGLQYPCLPRGYVEPLATGLRAQFLQLFICSRRGHARKPY